MEDGDIEKMRVIIAGSRPPKTLRGLEIERWYESHMPVLEDAIEGSVFTITSVISGRASGFDTLGEQWAHSQKPPVPVISMPAKWRLDDGSTDMGAGRKRNSAMGEIADAAIIIIINGSGGSEHMFRVMRALGKPVHVVRLREVG